MDGRSPLANGGNPGVGLVCNKLFADIVENSEGRNVSSKVTVGGKKVYLEFADSFAAAAGARICEIPSNKFLFDLILGK